MWIAILLLTLRPDDLPKAHRPPIVMECPGSECSVAETDDSRMRMVLSKQPIYIGTFSTVKDCQAALVSANEAADAPYKILSAEGICVPDQKPGWNN